MKSIQKRVPSIHEDRIAVMINTVHKVVHYENITFTRVYRQNEVLLKVFQYFKCELQVLC